MSRDWRNNEDIRKGIIEEMRRCCTVTSRRDGWDKEYTRLEGTGRS